MDEAYITSEEWPTGQALNLGSSQQFDVLAVGTTGTDGQVIGLVDRGRHAPPSVAVGGVPGYTAEAVVAAWADNPRVPDVEPSQIAELEGQTLIVPLYRTERPVTIDGAMEPTVNATALPGQSGPAWDPTILDFGPATETYSKRLDGLDLRLTWNNTATAYGDLHLLAQTSSGTVRGPDAAELPADGAHEARLDADLRGGRAVVVGPATDTLAVGADGLPYRIEGTAHFAGAPIVLPDAPT